jgi:hypothetical protein
MPPQPLSSIRRDARIFTGASSAKARPLLVQLVAHALATSSDIEYHMGSLLATMLGANAPPAIAMFYALTSSTGQADAIGAAAERVLGIGSNELDLFEIVMYQAKNAASHRNRFAHWAWAYCDELPDALLFIDPEALMAHDIADTRRQAPQDGRHLAGSLDRSRIFVYRGKDLNEAIAELGEASYCMAQFKMILSPSVRAGEAAEWRDHIYRHLLTRPVIAEALSRLRERRKNDPKARPSRRRRSRKEE